MVSFLQEVFRRLGGGHEPQAEADASMRACGNLLSDVIEHVIEETDARLRAVPGYARRLKEPLTGAFHHIDGLVEFALAFSGAEGSLFYIKRPSFGEVEGWRANLSERVTAEDLLAFQDELAQDGISARALVHRPDPTAGELKAGGGRLKLGLEAFKLPQDWWRVARGFIDAVLEDTLTPSSWTEYGSLLSGIDGPRQTQVVCAIIESAGTGQAVDCAV